ncbi:MAG: 2'-5' RNA ligase family protein [Streptosporangiaceae bacterium]
MISTNGSSAAMPAPPGEVDRVRSHWWWRRGWRPDRSFYTWHLTFEGSSELHDLVSSCHAALSEVNGLDLVPSEWLHVTMQGVGFIDDVRTEDVDRIVDAARVRLARLPPLRLTFRSAVIRTEAVALPPIPAGEVRGVRFAIRRGIADVWGTDNVPELPDPYEPHLSVAYVNTDQRAHPIAKALAGVRPEPVTARLTRASLIILRREDHLYRWDSYASVPFDDARR